MSENCKNRKSEKGFTLIELIVVLVILGLLASVVGYQIMNKVKEAKSRIAKIQLTEFEGCLVTYSLDLGHEPATAAGLEALNRNVENNDAWNGPYLAKDIPLDPWGHPYAYRFPGLYSTNYEIYSFGPDGIEGTDDDVCSWKQ